MLEHEERIRSQQEFKNELELRDRLNQDKNQYEKEEMRGKNIINLYLIYAKNTSRNNLFRYIKEYLNTIQIDTKLWIL